MTAPQGERPSAPSPVPTLSSPQTTDATSDLMHGPDGRTARLTFISVLVGAMLATTVAALPPTPSEFARTVLTGDHLLLDLQVLAVLLVVFDAWIQYSWSVILGFARFDFLSNFLLFLTAVVVIGWALCVSDFRAWVAWSVPGAAVIVINSASLRFIRGVRVPWWRLAYYAALLLSDTYVACDAYGLLPT